MRRTRILAAWVGVLVCLSPGNAEAQANAMPQSRPPAQSSTADSLAYLRDSTMIDSLAPFVPVDSLRQLYRGLASAPDRTAAMRELQCEMYRLWYIFGRSGELADERVRVEEWTPRLASVIDSARGELQSRFLPSRSGCGVAADERRVAERYAHPRSAPWRRLYVPHGSTLDAVRRSASQFEGTLRTRMGGRDTTLAIAGSAIAGQRSDRYLELRFSDALHPIDDYHVITLRIAPGPFAYQGSYPIFDIDVEMPGVASVYLQSRLPIVGQFGPPRGMLVVERADSTGFQGRVDMSIERNGVHLSRTPSPPDSLRDVIRFRARFRAVYDREEERDRLWAWRFPHPPRRFDSRRRADAKQTLRRIFVDETVPCERLPIYSPESQLTPRRVHSGRPVRAALSMWVDSTGTPSRASIQVLAIDDTAARRDFRRQFGLRFRRSAPDQYFGRVRCTLTLP